MLLLLSRVVCVAAREAVPHTAVARVVDHSEPVCDAALIDSSWAIVAASCLSQRCNTSQLAINMSVGQIPVDQTL